MNDLTPEQSEAVRRLLTDARSDEPVPADVAARLDGVLAGLTADRAGDPEAEADSPAEPETAPVIPLRRRRWPQVLVAAAAVTVVGFTGTQLVSGGGGDADKATGGSDAPAASELDANRDGNAAEGARPEEADAPTGANGDSFARGATHELDRDLQRLGVRRLVPLGSGRALARNLNQVLDELAAAGQPNAYGPQSANKALRPLRRCGPHYSVDGGRYFLARYSGHVALVLTHPVLGDQRLVEVYDCEAAAPRRTVELVTLPTRE